MKNEQYVTYIALNSLFYINNDNFICLKNGIIIKVIIDSYKSTDKIIEAINIEPSIYKTYREFPTFITYNIGRQISSYVVYNSDIRKKHLLPCTIYADGNWNYDTKIE